MAEAKHTLRILRGNKSKTINRPTRTESAAAVVRVLFWTPSPKRPLRLVK